MGLQALYSEDQCSMLRFLLGLAGSSERFQGDEFWGWGGVEGVARLCDFIFCLAMVAARTQLSRL